MSKKIMVLPASGKKFDMVAVTIEQVQKEFKVSQGLFKMASEVIPTLFNIGNFSIDVPMFDTKKHILSLALSVKEDGEDKYKIKFNVSFGDDPHTVEVTTDGGKTWKKLSYSGPKENEYAVAKELPKVAEEEEKSA